MAVKTRINLFLEMHSYFMMGARSLGETAPGYKPELESYQLADASIREPRVWQEINDACLEASDMAALQKAGERIASEFVFGDRDGASLIFKAMASAWPRWESRELTEYRIGLQQLQITVFQSIFEDIVAPRVLPRLYERLGFVPLDAPVTLYPVLSGYVQGAWGRTAEGYYLLVPAARRPKYVIAENILHELTHVIEASQPVPGKTLVARLRRKASSADSKSLEDLIHGLVVWNAGEMISRYVRDQHQPRQSLSLDAADQIKRFKAVYSGPWSDYLDGKISADAVIDALAAAVKTPPATASTPG